MILFIKHIDIEGPETLGEFFKERGFDSAVVDLSRGDVLPDTLADIDAVVCLGGPMNVYEEDKLPYLKDENKFIQQILKENIPFVGVCLGSQLLAKACGAKVVKSPNKEVGFSFIEFTEKGNQDVLFKGLDKNLEVYQWHEDMFEIPSGAVLLAKGKGCPHQAFRMGENAYGLQFHVEITDKSIREWSDKYFKKEDEAMQKKKQEMLDDYQTKKERFEKEADIIFENFLKIIAQKRTAV